MDFGNVSSTLVAGFDIQTFFSLMWENNVFLPIVPYNLHGQNTVIQHCAKVLGSQKKCFKAIHLNTNCIFSQKKTII